MSLQQIETKKIRTSRFNPRLESGKEAQDELIRSIRRTGVLQPIIVRPKGDMYEVVVGQRRYRAAQQASLDRVPAIVRTYSDEQVAELSLTENVQREDLTAVEKGRSIMNLLEKFPEDFPNIKTVADALGYSVPVIRAWLELARAPRELQALIEPVGKSGVPRKKGTIDSDTALSITRQIRGPDRQVSVAKALARIRVYRRAARKVVKQAALHPEKSVGEILNKILEEPPSIPFLPEHASAIRKGMKIQTSRKTLDPKIRLGSKVEAYSKFAELRVTDIARKKLGDFTAEDAKNEGGYTIEEFVAVWKKLHGGWNPNETVNVIRFAVEKNTD